VLPETSHGASSAHRMRPTVQGLANLSATPNAPNPPAASRRNRDAQARAKGGVAGPVSTERVPCRESKQDP